MIRADLSDQTVVDDANIAQEYVPVTAADRYKRHGHYPGLILVENNPELATRLERALFDDRFRSRTLECRCRFAFGFRTAVSSVRIRRPRCDLFLLRACSGGESSRLAGNRYFDLSSLQFSLAESEAVRNVLSRLQSLRT
jgi:hypothetical protein